MGLDGISVNQLRITQENTSRENAINADLKATRELASKTVDSLDKKSAIDTDDKENTSFFGGESSADEEQEENNDELPIEEHEKIDLTNKDLYEIKPDENTNSLVIYNKEQNVVVQQISPNELSTLVDSLKNPSGILVNKRI